MEAVEEVGREIDDEKEIEEEVEAFAFAIAEEIVDGSEVIVAMLPFSFFNEAFSALAAAANEEACDRVYMGGLDAIMQARTI